MVLLSDQGYVLAHCSRPHHPHRRLFYKIFSPASLVPRKSACSSSVCRSIRSALLPHPAASRRRSLPLHRRGGSKKDPEETRCFLRIALFLTFFISLLLALCLWGFSDVIAARFCWRHDVAVAAAARTSASPLCRSCLPYRLFSRKSRRGSRRSSTN